MGEKLQKGWGTKVKQERRKKKKKQLSVYLIIVCARQVLECCSVCLEAMVSDRLQVKKKKNTLGKSQKPSIVLCALLQMLGEPKVRTPPTSFL